MILSKRRTPRKIEKHPLVPCVTLEQICAFDPQKPETYTPSPTLNQILAAMCVVKPVSAVTLGKYLDVAPKKLTGAIELITGMQYADVREKWVKSHLQRLEKEHPNWTQDQLAQAVGFADSSAVWRMDHRNKRKQEYRELKALLHHRTREDWERDMAAKKAEQENWIKWREESGLSNPEQQ